MLPIKILAIGAGGLQRALTHEFVHILNQRNLYNGGIFVGQPRGTEKADAFNRQNGVYHVVTFDADGVHDIQQVSSVVGATTFSTETGSRVVLFSDRESTGPRAYRCNRSRNRQR